MRYSFMTFSCPELPLSAVLDLAIRHGYDAIEPRAEAGHAHGIEIDANPEERSRLRSLVADRGIALSCIATSCRYADPATADGDVERTGSRRAGSRTDRFGIRLVPRRLGAPEKGSFLGFLRLGDR